MINNRRSFITGIKGTKLSQRSCLFKKYKPWDLLFSRNIVSISQTQNYSHIKKFSMIKLSYFN